MIRALVVLFLHVSGTFEVAHISKLLVAVNYHVLIQNLPAQFIIYICRYLVYFLYWFLYLCFSLFFVNISFIRLFALLGFNSG